MVLCENRRELITKNGIIELTFYEYKFIQYLINNKGRNCTYKELIIYIYDVDENIYKLFKNSFRLLLKRLKKKLQKENLLITTVYNYGIFMTYIDNKEKEIIENFEKKIKINKLKKEIKEKTEQLKILEDKINER